MVTDSEQLIKNLIEIYDQNKVLTTDQATSVASMKRRSASFGQLEEFFSYPRVYFAAKTAILAMPE